MRWVLAPAHDTCYTHVCIVGDLSVRGAPMRGPTFRHVVGWHALPLTALFTIIAIICPQGLLLVATLTTLAVGAAINHA